ncbi:methyl-accepting chemotaxis protein [Niameybacter massiliensis]|uniref:methyl-accepting chemotaxis protein n=1 Tax=Niameybacter massiliensis TaxID=1658108 RepID=UPI0006B5EFAB|nr:methyl-accepting chemotaxis protein [Niameybacter massiliensis]
MKRVHKSIREKIERQFSMILLFTALLLTVVAISIGYTTVNNTVKEMMPEIVTMTASAIENKLELFKNVVTNVAKMEGIADPDIPMSEKFGELEENRAYINADTLVMATMDGDIIRQDGKKASIKDTDVYMHTKKGETYISSPQFNPVSETMRFNVATPIYYNGEMVNILVATFDAGKLTEMISELKIGDNGRAFIIDQTGTTIAHLDTDRVNNQENIMTLAQEDKKYKTVSRVHEKMINGELGMDTYKFGGKKYISGYGPIPGTQWSVGISLPNYEVVKELRMLVAIMLVLCIVCLVVGGRIIRKLAYAITQPIESLTERAKKMQEGDLSSTIAAIETKDELETLFISLRDMMRGIAVYIKDIDYVLHNLAEGDLTVASQIEYKGDFAPIKQSLNMIGNKLNTTIKEIHHVSEHVLEQAGRVSETATELAASATEQAASIEEMNATINDMADQIKTSSNHAQQVNEVAQTVMVEIEQGTGQMRQMGEAIVKIQASTGEISEIIKVIDQIAAQTNLLALNASIEAARAGDAGRGFLVVANEVKDLAARSMQAAKQTTELVDATVQSVEGGTEIITKTTGSFNKIVESIDTVIASVEKSAEIAHSQSEAVTDITAAIDEISQLVQTTAANAEESSASSDELANSAKVLQEKINHFKVN